MRRPKSRACGKLLIDALVVEEAIDAAMRTRLADPRRAAKMGAHLAKVNEQRATIETEISTLEASADELAAKTAAWGLARVEKAMTPLLNRVNQLRSQLATLEGPGPAATSAADAVAAWDEAVTRRDVTTMRAMIKRAFPNLTVLPKSHPHDHSPTRLLWDGRQASSGPRVGG